MKLGLCASCNNLVSNYESILCKSCVARQKRAGRVCKRQGCSTRLSTLNRDSECYRHADDTRMRKVFASAVTRTKSTARTVSPKSKKKKLVSV
ncbi:hypothetical protein BDD14_0706 [Edaphobacter modestus]|uniref:Uncharacterized protein n=1 Tax=Edaphobacter modestus TaxID=388466 RepID=A0A4Q7YNW4_9BACT|nr:hypothetical protein BDD14_0706 [Edaphobacter modestus]